MTVSPAARDGLVADPRRPLPAAAPGRASASDQSDQPDQSPSASPPKISLNSKLATLVDKAADKAPSPTARAALGGDCGMTKRCASAREAASSHLPRAETRLRASRAACRSPASAGKKNRRRLVVCALSAARRIPFAPMSIDFVLTVNAARSSVQAALPWQALFDDIVNALRTHAVRHVAALSPSQRPFISAVLTIEATQEDALRSSVRSAVLEAVAGVSLAARIHLKPLGIRYDAGVDYLLKDSSSRALGFTSVPTLSQVRWQRALRRARAYAMFLGRYVEMRYRPWHSGAQEARSEFNECAVHSARSVCSYVCREGGALKNTCLHALPNSKLATLVDKAVPIARARPSACLEHLEHLECGW